MGPLQWFLLVLLSLLWGGSFFLTEIILEEVSPFTQVAVRVSLGALVLLVWIRLKGETLPRGLADWRLFLIMGVLNNVLPFSLIVWGQTSISGGLASIINASTPLFTVFLTLVLLRAEPLGRLKLLGVLAGFVGVAILIGGAALAGTENAVWGQLAVAGAALSYAMASIFGRRLTRYSTPVAATGMLICSSAVMLPLAIWFKADLFLPSTGVVASLFALGVGCTAIAYLIYFRILRDAGPLNLMLVTFLIPPSALILEYLFLDHAPSARQMAGMLIIFLGLALVDGRIFKKSP